MKVNTVSIEDVKKKIECLKGKTIKMQVNKGRKQIVRFNAEIKDIYPSVFTVEVQSPAIINLLSYSYTEVLCGNVKISPNQTPAAT